jgi:hypothetical protein
MVTLTAGIMFLLLTFGCGGILRRWSTCGLTAYEVVRY